MSLPSRLVFGFLRLATENLGTLELAPKRAQECWVAARLGLREARANLAKVQTLKALASSKLSHAPQWAKLLMQIPRQGQAGAEQAAERLLDVCPRDARRLWAAKVRPSLPTPKPIERHPSCSTLQHR